MFPFPIKYHPDKSDILHLTIKSCPRVTVFVRVLFVDVGYNNNRKKEKKNP